ncbi:hypothetical protein J3F83DRAFT_735750 [Trichoderma novae-zelandiae]
MSRAGDCLMHTSDRMLDYSRADYSAGSIVSPKCLHAYSLQADKLMHMDEHSLRMPPALLPPPATRTAASPQCPSNDMHDGCDTPSPSTGRSMTGAGDGCTRLLRRCTTGQLPSSSPLYIKSFQCLSPATSPLGSGAVGRSDSGCWEGFPSMRGTAADATSR